MSKIISNQRLSKDFYLMCVGEKNSAKMGQFYMLRAWDAYPILSRPISVYDADGETIFFLYKVVGRGTEIFAALKAGDEIALQGPYGSCFPTVSGKVALVGGGVGIAPLYLAAKELRAAAKDCTIDIYLGFSDQSILTDDYEKVADNLSVDVGGLITDRVSPAQYDCIMTCGPEPMMRALYEKCKKAGVADQLVVSMEKRMACGVGACLACSCQTKSGNKKVCKDGPVLSGEEVFGV